MSAKLLPLYSYAECTTLVMIRLTMNIYISKTLRFCSYLTELIQMTKGNDIFVIESVSRKESNPNNQTYDPTKTKIFPGLKGN